VGCFSFLRVEIDGYFRLLILVNECSVGKNGSQVGNYETQVGKYPVQVGKNRLQVRKVEKRKIIKRKKAAIPQKR
jgi:hypothetical protein